MISAIDFLKKDIKDNNFDGIFLHENIELTYDDDVFHDKKSRNKEISRKIGLCDYLKSLYNFVSDRNIDSLVNQITFGEEFDANKKQKIFNISGDSFEDLKIYTNNIVGSINYKGVQFNVNSRFGNEFLQYMIANSSGFLELENLGNIDKDIGLGEWILIYYWKIQLKKAFALGLYKTYKEKKDDLSIVRGKINTNEYINKIYFDGKINCSYKEHSYDNIINYIISLALRKVFKKDEYRQIVQDIFEIKNAFDTIQHKKVNLKLLNNHKVLNPFYYKYNEVFNLSLNILNNNFASIGEKSQDFSAFLFDISLLFEHHIRKILQRSFLLFQKNKKEFLLPNGIYENNLYPDIIINHGENKISIFDVKYKHFNIIHGVDREDRFQLTSYVATFMSKYEIVECGFIYPSKQVPEQNIIKNNQMLNICNKTIPFKIYLYSIEDTSTDFLKKQKNNDKQFLSNFYKN
jgi:5-methylcytosine-specific restriction endonuclease McrBC regulatory subunit McrC